MSKYVQYKCCMSPALVLMLCSGCVAVAITWQPLTFVPFATELAQPACGVTKSSHLTAEWSAESPERTGVSKHAWG